MYVDDSVDGFRAGEAKGESARRLCVGRAISVNDVVRAMPELRRWRDGSSRGHVPEYIGFDLAIGRCRIVRRDADRVRAGLLLLRAHLGILDQGSGSVII